MHNMTTYLEYNDHHNSSNEQKQQIFSEPCTPVNPVSQSHHFHGFFQTILFLKNQLLEETKPIHSLNSY